MNLWSLWTQVAASVIHCATIGEVGDDPPALTILILVQGIEDQS